MGGMAELAAMAIAEVPVLLEGTAIRRNRRIVFAAGTGVFQRLAQVASTLVIMPMLLKVLGSAQFGVWGAAASLAWLSGLVDLGMGSALVTSVANATARGQENEARRLVTGALTAGSALAGVVLAGAAVLFVYLQPTQSWPYFIAVVGLALNIPLSTANSLWMSLQQGYVSGFWELVQTVLTTAGLGVAAATTKDVRVYVAIVYGGLVIANLGSLGHFLLRQPQLRPAWVDNPLRAARSVAGMGLLYCALAVTGGFSFMLDNILALQLLGPDASARMTIALRICVTALGMLGVISQPLWPAFAEAATRGDLSWIRRGLLRGSLLLIGMAVAGSAVLVAAGGPFLRWWLRADLGIGQDLLWAIAAWTVMQAIVRVPGLLLNALWVVAFQVGVGLAGTSTAIALKMLLAPQLGVAGILWGTTASVAVILIPAAMWRIWRWSKEKAI